MNKNSLTKLNKLVDDILAGNRTVLIPPGIFYVATSIGLLLIASVFLMGGTLSLFASFITVKQTAAAQLISVFPIVICVLFPSFMLFSGKKAIFENKVFLYRFYCSLQHYFTCMGGYHYRYILDAIHSQLRIGPHSTINRTLDTL